jgi:pSer/pThr/pTyr-binding forkhead associated (FHA) protein
MRPATDQGPRTTLADGVQHYIGQSSLSPSNDKIALLLEGNQMATIFVIGGASKGLEYELTKPKTTIGQTGGGADIEIDDQQASALHCVVTGAKDADMVRLYDLRSVNGTYVNDERIQAVSLSHFSEFRIGSTTLLVTIVSKHSNETT